MSRLAAPYSSAGSKLLVTNLSSSATLASVRQFFSQAGEVLEVEFVAERGHGMKPSSAYVTMGTLREAEAAIIRLHSRLLHDRSVMVSLAPPTAERTADKARRPAPVTVGVSISQQYRERHAMVYEIDCSGVRLTVRFFFQEDAQGPRRVAASVHPQKDFALEATGATLELAFAALAKGWLEQAANPAAHELDWAQITAALKTVRAM